MQNPKKVNWPETKVLVTGGTGSIGSEIVRQLLALNTGVIRILSRDETKHYMLYEELGERPNLRYLVGDIRDKSRLKRAMEGIDVVFHAAALKHVPSCEYNPFEAVQTNVIGTQNVIEAAMDAGVKKVIAISTDKAVNPLYTMGTTKLLSEKIVIAADAWSKNTALAAVRFGNVLGSRGSIVPIAREQIRKGGPVILTDRQMTRFVMTIPDAVGLVLKACQFTTGGEVFILKMPVLKIADLIDVMIEEFAGQGQKIAVKVTQPRFGEKLHEELMTRDESRRIIDMKTEGMFVIHQQYKLEKLGIKPERLPESKFVSSEARKMTKKEIRTMLQKVYESLSL